MFDIDGAIDMHIHSGPDLIGRVGDDFEIATGSRDGGMAGMAVKLRWLSVDPLRMSVMDTDGALR